MSETHRPTYALTIRAEGTDSRPAIIRLRSMLKLMLRTFGLRCLTIREIHPPTDAVRTPTDQDRPTTIAPKELSR